MREFDRLGLTVDADEVVEKRTSHSKTFALANGTFCMKVSSSPVHYQTENGLVDIDLQPVDMGDHWLVDKAPFVVKINKDSPAISYLGKASGLQIEMELKTVDGAVQSFRPEVNANGICFKGIEDNDLHVMISSSGIATEQHIKSEAGAKTLAWTVRQNQRNPVVTETRRAGIDANKNSAEITVARSQLVKKGAYWEHSFDERFTGKILRKDKTTRKRLPVDGAIYPVRVIS